MKKFTYMSSLLTFYLKGSVEIETNKVVTEVPNTVLGLIPLGKTKGNIAIDQIAAVDTSFHLDIKGFIIGILFIAFGVYFIKQGGFDPSAILVTLIFSGIGLMRCISALETILLIEKTSGAHFGILFVVFEKQKAFEICEIINEKIDDRLKDTNVRVHTTENTDRIIDAINKK
ncbi:MAG: hypothetical protein WBO70_06565 [Erysipelotrichaceae bacterium]